MKMKSATFPVLLIVFGIVWLLKSTELLPTTSTLLALLLAGAGVLLLALDGINKSTVVAAPLLMLAGLWVWAWPRFYFSFGLAGSLSLIVAGVLMLVARSPAIPERRGPPARLPADSDHPQH